MQVASYTVKLSSYVANCCSYIVKYTVAIMLDTQNSICLGWAILNGFSLVVQLLNTILMHIA